MMMARDLTPQRPELDPASVDALSSALLRFLEREDAADLQLALRRVADEARSKRMHAEQLLVALKDVWYALPPVQKTSETEAQSRTLQRIITLCIREYYRG